MAASTAILRLTGTFGDLEIWKHLMSLNGLTDQIAIADHKDWSVGQTLAIHTKRWYLIHNVGPQMWTTISNSDIDAVNRKSRILKGTPPPNNWS